MTGERVIDRLRSYDDENLGKSSQIMKDSTVIWTPLGEVVIPQLEKISEHCDWKEVDRVLSIYEKTGKYAIGLYAALLKARHNAPERMIDVIVPTEATGKKIRSFFKLITGANLPKGNIYVCDPSVEWDSDSVTDPVYAGEEVTPLVPELFEPKAVEPEENGKRKNYLTLEPVMKYDVIVGNPPYQSSDANSGNARMWPKFLRVSDKLLKEGAFISLIHPGSWKSYAAPNEDSLFRDIFKNKKIHHLEVNTASDHFSVNSTFDWYVMENVPPNGEKAFVRSKRNGEVEESKLSFDDLPCVPQRLNDESLSITRKLIHNDGQTLDVEVDYKFDPRRDYVSNEKSGDFEFPLKHTDGNPKWASKKHPLQNEPKVLMNRSGYLKPEYDSGKYGVTQMTFFQKVSGEEEANYILSLLESNLYTYFRRANKWSGFHHRMIIGKLPYVKSLDTENIDEELYNHFNLSDDEIKEIEQFLS